MAKRRISPEERASWEEARRDLAMALERTKQRIRLRRERRERRRARLRRLTFGLLGR